MSETVQHKKQSSVRRVLFVDDDKRFLETVRELMSVLSDGTWEVLIAESPSRLPRLGIFCQRLLGLQRLL